MTLINSISGIRGTIGGEPGQGLTPFDIVKFASAYAAFIKGRSKVGTRPHIVIGRDARPSGAMVSNLVSSTLIAMGADVTDLGLSTTPTVAIAVPLLKANGGIIITASHNPVQWNALKLLNRQGEFITARDGKDLLKIIESGKLDFVPVNKLGNYKQDDSMIRKHIDMICNLPLVDCDAISKAAFHVAIDCVNSSGGIAIPMLLEQLGVEKIEKLYCEPTGEFPHNPEPLPDNLINLSELIVEKKAHLGFAVDPDVDRLAIVMENGSMFGEEYTLVAVADYVLQHKKGNTVSNLSSTQALGDITKLAGEEYFASAVGEVNVVKMMKDKKAVIGGEGNGGVIYPDLHHGRDALVGIALFLTYLAKTGKRCSTLRDKYPDYSISKNKINLSDDIDVDHILKEISKKYSQKDVNTIDGVHISFDNEWVHLRKSNTEPIIRIYAESDSKAKADVIANKIINDISDIVKASQNGF